MDINFEEYIRCHSPGYVIEIYNNGLEEEFVFGNRETKPKIKKCDSETLYDIASLTKAYTATLVYMAYEEKKLQLYDFVKDIDCRFVNLDKVQVMDLLSHNQEIWTDGYLGSVKNREEFYKILFSASVKSTFPTYVDTHYIILSTLLEKIYNTTFDVLLKTKIFDALGLEKTTVNPNVENIASNNYETLNGKIITEIVPGIIHDTKARKAKELGIYTGHACIFTTGKELLAFLKSFLDCSLLKKETIELMLRHEDKNKQNYEILSQIVSGSSVNEMYCEALKIDENVQVMKTYNYMGTRYRNLILDLNDVPSYCSDNTIAFSGYTGPMFIIDFDKKVIVLIMCNIMHNTKLNRIERKKNTERMMEEICKSIYK